MKNTLSTKDIYLAAALSALGARLESVDKSDPKHMEFVFVPKQEFQTGALADLGQNLEALKLEWTNRTLMVNAADYSEAIKRMKSEVHTFD